MDTRIQYNPGLNEPVVSPAGGIGIPVVAIADGSGNLAGGGSGGLQTNLFRDSQPTVQAGSTAAAPGAGATVATITPGTAGLWEITGSVSISGTTAAAADSNNFKLVQTSTTKIGNIPYEVPSTGGGSGTVPIPAVVLQLAAADTVSIQAVGAATAGSVYAAALVARRVG